MEKYSFEKSCDSQRLTQEIEESAIVTALDRIERTTTTDIWFKVALSTEDSATLTALVTAHVNTPLADFEVKTVIVSTMPDPQPFATPSYRTKRNATAALIEVEPDGVGDIDFLMTAERYVSGGSIIVENAEIGDWLEAWVEDDDSIIPSPYRAALCEDWPLVAKYIEREWMKVSVPGTVQAGSISYHEINTYPLNAKITAGLYLCVHYHAVNSGLTRRIGVNYSLTKKL